MFSLVIDCLHLFTPIFLNALYFTAVILIFQPEFKKHETSGHHCV